MNPESGAFVSDLSVLGSPCEETYKSILNIGFTLFASFTMTVTWN